MSSQEAQLAIIVVTHVDYGSALLRAVELILGPVQDCVSIQVDSADIAEETVSRLNEAVERLDGGRGALVLTDMFGGTPTNMSLALLKKHKNLEVLTGVNLPMLLKVMANRHLPLNELAELAKVAGCEGIIAAASMLRGKTEGKHEAGEVKRG